MINHIQVLEYSTDVLNIATIALLVSVPFQIIGQVIVFIGVYREEHIESNWFHRMFAFCDSTILGKLLLGLCVSSPVLLIFVANILIAPNNLVAAISMALIPWILCPIYSIVELRGGRKYPHSR